MGWLLYALTLNPEIDAKVFAELNENNDTVKVQVTPLSSLSTIRSKTLPSRGAARASYQCSLHKLTTTTGSHR